jgi:hypothetical protein
MRVTGFFVEITEKETFPKWYKKKEDCGNLSISTKEKEKRTGKEEKI